MNFKVPWEPCILLGHSHNFKTAYCMFLSCYTYSPLQMIKVLKVWLNRHKDINQRFLFVCFYFLPVVFRAFAYLVSLNFTHHLIFWNSVPHGCRKTNLFHDQNGGATQPTWQETTKPRTKWVTFFPPHVPLCNGLRKGRGLNGEDFISLATKTILDVQSQIHLELYSTSSYV